MLGWIHAGDSALLSRSNIRAGADHHSGLVDVEHAAVDGGDRAAMHHTGVRCVGNRTDGTGRSTGATTQRRRTTGQGACCGVLLQSRVNGAGAEIRRRCLFNAAELVAQPGSVQRMVNLI